MIKIPMCCFVRLFKKCVFKYYFRFYRHSLLVIINCLRDSQQLNWLVGLRLRLILKSTIDHRAAKGHAFLLDQGWITDARCLWLKVLLVCIRCINYGRRIVLQSSSSGFITRRSVRVTAPVFPHPQFFSCLSNVYYPNTLKHEARLNAI
jgi:hypothetical protein